MWSHIVMISSINFPQLVITWEESLILGLHRRQLACEHICCKLSRLPWLVWRNSTWSVHHRSLDCGPGLEKNRESCINNNHTLYSTFVTTLSVYHFGSLKITSCNREAWVKLFPLNWFYLRYFIKQQKWSRSNYYTSDSLWNSLYFFLQGHFFFHLQMRR